MTKNTHHDQDLDHSGGREDQEEAKQQKHPRPQDLDKKSDLNKAHSEHINSAADVDESGKLRR